MVMYGIVGEQGVYIGLLHWEITDRHVVMRETPLDPQAVANSNGMWELNGTVVHSHDERCVACFNVRCNRKRLVGNSVLSITLPVGHVGEQVVETVLFDPNKCNFKTIHDKAGVTSYNGFDGFYWKCDDGNFRYFTAVVMRELSKKIHHYEQDCFDNERRLVSEIEAAEDISSVDVSLGWPSVDITI